MSQPYAQISNKLDNTAKPYDEIKKLKIDMAKWASTPGGRIIKALGNSRTFDHLFREFAAFGHATGDWRWDPGVIGAKKGQLLDGTLQCGECAFFAANLQLLAIAPEPFGLGMDKKDIEYWAFYGKHKQGFVAKHDQTHSISKFIANVRLPEQVQAPTDFYVWPNHKVLVYQGKVYDPSYGTITGKRPYLGVYQVKPQRVWTRDQKAQVTNGNPIKRELRATVTIEDDEYVVAGDDDLSDFLFRKVPAQERPEQPFSRAVYFGNRWRSGAVLAVA